MSNVKERGEDEGNPFDGKSKKRHDIRFAFNQCRQLVPNYNRTLNRKDCQYLTQAGVNKLYPPNPNQPAGTDSDQPPGYYFHTGNTFGPCHDPNPLLAGDPRRAAQSSKKIKKSKEAKETKKGEKSKKGKETKVGKKQGLKTILQDGSDNDQSSVPLLAPISPE